MSVLTPNLGPLMAEPKRLALIVGARPNYMKAAPLMRQLQQRPARFTPLLIHTGQHYDEKLSALFFDQLGLPEPDLNLGVGSGTHGAQTGRLMTELERAFEQIRPDMVVVFGDVNSTMAAALVAAKVPIPVVHVEAGLRSFDPAMPEEVNRIVTDRLSQLLFVSDPAGLVNLRREGANADDMYYVGNIMIDSLVAHRAASERSDILSQLGLSAGGYGVLTMHRPSNVDDSAHLESLLWAVHEASRNIPMVFPCHPRTRNEIARLGARREDDQSRLRLVEPLGYLDFLQLQANARFVITDSGGVQEETTWLGVPCLTIRHSTERPVTVEVGTNRLIGPNPAAIVSSVAEILSGSIKTGIRPLYWDGRTAERIVAVLLERLFGEPNRLGDFSAEHALAELSARPGSAHFSG